MSAPLVSILLPVFNESAHIRKCLDSCLALSYPNIEVVVSDNASTDDTWTILQEYAARDGRVMLHRFNREQHVIDNLYWCVENARGDLVFHGGGDDYFKSPAFLDPITQEFSNDPRLAGFLSRLQYFDDASGQSLQLGPPDHFELLFSLPRVAFVKLYLQYCAHDEPLLAVYRRELLLEAMREIRYSGLESPGWWLVLHMYLSALNKGWRYVFDREAHSVLMKRINKTSSVAGVNSSAGVNISRRDPPGSRVSNSLRYARVISALVPALHERLLIRALLLYSVRRKSEGSRRFPGAGWSRFVGKKLFGTYTLIHKDYGLGRAAAESLRRRIRGHNTG